jgi:hypothetical protein
MQRIELTKDWGDYEAGTVFTVLGDGAILERGGRAVSLSGSPIKGPVVDPQRAAQLESDGFLSEPKPKRAKKKSSRKGGK